MTGKATICYALATIQHLTDSIYSSRFPLCQATSAATATSKLSLSCASYHRLFVALLPPVSHGRQSLILIDSLSTPAVSGAAVASRRDVILCCLCSKTPSSKAPSLTAPFPDVSFSFFLLLLFLLCCRCCRHRLLVSFHDT